MSTMLPPTPAPAPVARSWWRGWYNFWFRGADPTTFAFIRICTGVLVLYIHLAYSLDLQAFFGKHGWYASAFVDRERHESPSFLSSLTDWNDPFVLVRLSDFPHRRTAFMEFLRSLPEDKAERTVALAYLARANEMRDPDEFFNAIRYVEQMGTRSMRDHYLTVLRGGKVEEEVVSTGGPPKKVDSSSSYQPPALFATLPLEERMRIADEIEAFWNTLARVKWSDTTRGREYVLNFLKELGVDSRMKLVEFILKLGNESAAEQHRILDYLEYWNFDPRASYRMGSGIFSVWFHVTDPTQMALVHTGILILILMFTIGLFTRVTSILVWIAVISYIHRTQQVLFGMDTMMNILLFYLMLGNSGAALSVDRLIARYRATRASLRRTGTIDANTRAFLACPPPSVSAGFAQRLLQVHFCFIYMAAGLAKLKGPSWWTGNAFWDVLINPEFTLLKYTWYEEAVRVMASVKPLYYFTITSAVYFTLFIEIGLPFLVWTRLRWVVVFLAALMHAIIAVIMGLNLFELLMIVMLLAYLPDRVIRDRFRGGVNLLKYTFAFNPSSEKQSRAAAMAVALDVDNQISLAPEPGTPETVLTPAGSKPATGTEGGTALFRGLRLFSVVSLVLWIPGVRALLTRRIFPTAATPTAAPSVKPPTPAAR